MGPLRDNPPATVDFFEVAPENWIGIGGKPGKLGFGLLTRQRLQLREDPIQLRHVLLARDDRHRVKVVEPQLPRRPIAQPHQPQKILDNHVSHFLAGPPGRLGGIDARERRPLQAARGVESRGHFKGHSLVLRKTVPPGGVVGNPGARDGGIRRT